MNCDPLTVTVVTPSENPSGVTPLSTGIGFQIWTVIEPGMAPGYLAMELVIWTELGLGTTAGAV